MYGHGRVAATSVLRLSENSRYTTSMPFSNYFGSRRMRNDILATGLTDLYIKLRYTNGVLLYRTTSFSLSEPPSMNRTKLLDYAIFKLRHVQG
jgi:hypothetical protein